MHKAYSNVISLLAGLTFSILRLHG